jgi:hypothetical protein
MKKWEYLMAINPTPAYLNDLGTAGWELVSVVRLLSSNDDKCYFKREYTLGLL